MTDGTSQGLFIVVAIVIFGIFAVLAYILFEDTLSPAMANMFTTATEQASFNFDSVNGFTTQDLMVYNRPEDKFNVISRSRNSLVMQSEGNSTQGSGVYIHHDMFEPNKSYHLEYDVTLLGGEVTRIDGHNKVSSSREKYIDGVHHETVQGTLEGLKYFKLEKGKTHKIREKFTTDLLLIGEDGKRHTENFSYAHIYIQPNKGFVGEATPFKVRISNLRFYEVNE